MKEIQTNNHVFPLITVIVPVYNVEKYLNDCIESVCKQKYTNIEIILVNDGSTDNSGKLCDEIAKKDRRIRVIHQQNMGLSGARNTAIDIAKGAYLTFVDSDDIIEADMISTLYDEMIKNGAEIAVTSLKSFFENGKTYTNNLKNEVLILSKEQALDCFLFNDYLTPCVCGKLYKAQLWDNIRCPQGKLHEDQYTTYKLIDKTNKIVYITSPKYNYRKHSDSIGQRKFTDKTYDLYYAINEEYNFIYQKYKELCPNIAVARITWELVFINMMIRSGNNDKLLIIKLKKFIKMNYKKVMQCPYIDIKRKMQIFLFFFNYNFYKYIYLKYKHKHPIG